MAVVVEAALEQLARPARQAEQVAQVHLIRCKPARLRRMLLEALAVQQLQRTAQRTLETVQQKQALVVAVS
jgi:hypothetical protein